MKKKLLKSKKTAPHAKTSPKAQTCDCCGHSPCTCPEGHEHKK